MKLQRIVIKSFTFDFENEWEFEVKLKDFARVLNKKKKTESFIFTFLHQKS